MGFEAGLVSQDPIADFLDRRDARRASSYLRSIAIANLYVSLREG
jgi:hypothetical protein